jgi:rare lipoprotein A
VPVRLEIAPPPPIGRGGPVRRLREQGGPLAGVLALLFILHCTGPRPVPGRPATPRSGGRTAGDSFTEEGEASWYGGNGDGFAGRHTASGEVFDPSQLTCAHRTLPLGSFVEVENLDNGRKAILKVNDRGPFARGRVLDASRGGAKELGFLAQGTARIRLHSVDPEGRPVPVDPGFDRQDPYTIQVAALSDPANIERLSAELRDLYGTVTLEGAPSRSGQPLRRVRVGRFEKYEEAEKTARDIARRLKGRGVEPFVTRVQ